MGALIACDIHPLNNLRVLNALRSQFGADNAQVKAWIGRWILDGFGALEILLERHGGLFAYGDNPTLADCYLVPQVYNAERYGIPLGQFPRVLAAAETARALDAVASAHPNLQADAER
jgi:maleylpyruvate isomerase